MNAPGIALAAAACALSLSGLPAAAEDYESRTTSIAEKSCKVSRLRVDGSYTPFTS
jgi:hypothetical protein